MDQFEAALELDFKSLEKGEHPKWVDIAMSCLSQIQWTYADELSEINLNEVIDFYAIDVDDENSPLNKKDEKATKWYF